jgi:hypothetical protein
LLGRGEAERAECVDREEGWTPGRSEELDALVRGRAAACRRDAIDACLLAAGVGSVSVRGTRREAPEACLVGLGESVRGLRTDAADGCLLGAGVGRDASGTRREALDPGLPMFLGAGVRSDELDGALPSCCRDGSL